MELRLNVVGVSFHVGTGCSDSSSFGNAIARAREVFDEGTKFGFTFSILDIGGGYPGYIGAKNGNDEFEKMAKVINYAYDKHFHDITGLTLIAEPGQFLCRSAYILVTNIISRRIKNNVDDEPSFMYYINDGIYGSFNWAITDKSFLSINSFLLKQSNGIYSHSKIKDFRNLFTSSIWGPTGDSLDVVCKSIELPKLLLGDWMIFDNMGAYTFVCSSCFNGMTPPNILYLAYDQEVYSINNN